MTDSLPSFVVKLQGFDRCADGHLAHLELGPAVELDPGEIRMQRAQRVGDHGPADLALLGINRELSLDMLDVEEPDALGSPGRAGLGERPPLGGLLGRGIGALGPGRRAQQPRLTGSSQTPKMRIGLDMVFPDRVWRG